MKNNNELNKEDLELEKNDFSSDENKNKKIELENKHKVKNDMSTNDTSKSANKPNGANEINVDQKDSEIKKPIKELPIEKKPFNEFITNHLIPELKDELQKIGKYVIEIKLLNDIRPIAGDKCWYIFCSIKDTCNFWLSFEKDDITSLKSFSLTRFNEEPSVLESFLIDEKKITLKLIISRILQRLNGQKLLGFN
tara:strand:+ start:29 stop:613 length:585 start_codon:yes stop_codon:yes gene_type:complete